LLHNKSNLPAKFEVLAQDDSSKILAIINPSSPCDEIEPVSTYQLNLEVITKKTGSIKIPVIIKIVGQNTLPTNINVTAHSVGPVMHCKQEVLDFGKVDVLKTHEIKLTLINQSIIPAEFTLFTANRESVFFIEEKEGRVEKKGVHTLKVYCSPDEAMKFNDTLMVHVKHGTDLEIPLRCFGIGNTITPDINLSDIKFGDQYTSAEVETEFFIANKGRKAVKITWSRVLDSEQIERYFKSMKSVEIDKSKLKSKRFEMEDPFFAFKIYPETFTLEPRTGIHFTV
jgi:hypothetical protein